MRKRFVLSQESLNINGMLQHDSVQRRWLAVAMSAKLCQRSKGAVVRNGGD